MKERTFKNFEAAAYAKDLWKDLQKQIKESGLTLYNSKTGRNSITGYVRDDSMNNEAFTFFDVIYTCYEIDKAALLVRIRPGTHYMDPTDVKTCYADISRFGAAVKQLLSEQKAQK